MIGTLNEKSLHAALKLAIAQPGDQFEVPLGRYHIDIVRGEQLIEIQTGHFSPLKKKLAELVKSHHTTLVYPIAAIKYILNEDKEGERLSRRKSPKKGVVEHVFGELVAIPHLLNEPNFKLEVLLIEMEEVRRPARKKRWRSKGWAVHERRLVGISERVVFCNSADCLALLPDNLPSPFTTSDLSKAIRKPRRLAQQMTYCLRNMDAIEMVGKQGNAILYEIAG